MVESLEIYKCLKCGIMVEVINGGLGTMVCCGEPMKAMKENTTDAAVEKHVPVVEKVEGGIKVTVGSVAHPMAEDHYIEWIEVVDGGKSSIQRLKPGQPPEAVFAGASAGASARAYCNLHGFWKS